MSSLWIWQRQYSKCSSILDVVHGVKECWPLHRKKTEVECMDHQWRPRWRPHLNKRHTWNNMKIRHWRWRWDLALVRKRIKRWVVQNGRIQFGVGLSYWLLHCVCNLQEYKKGEDYLSMFIDLVWVALCAKE